MNSWTLIKKSLVYHRRTHLGVVLGSAVATAVLTGALLVGDSVRYSLKSLALSRLGETRLALSSGNRFFRAALAEDLEVELGTSVAPLITLRGVLADPEGQRTRINVLGTDNRFFEMGSMANPLAGTTVDGSFDGGVTDGRAIAVNEALARRMGITPGDEVLLRVEKPQLLPREAPLSLDRDLSASLRLTVRAVLSDEGIGRFSLRASQAAPLNAFVQRDVIEEAVGLEEMANLLLVGAAAVDIAQAGPVTVEVADSALKRCFRLDDAGLSVRELPDRGCVELRSSRIFLEPEVARAAAKARPKAMGVLTYFVNGFAVGDRHAPYAFAAALGPLNPGAAADSVLPEGLGEGGIAINQWLADDLGTGVGENLEVSYYVMGPGRRLEERTAAFTIRAVLPMAGATLDPDLMPAYPGLAEGERCSDWDPGVDIDLSRIRDNDEDYWATYRGTPKACLTLEAGQALWQNRFGTLTAVRYPYEVGAAQSIGIALEKELDPVSIGLYFRPVREEALAAGRQGTDFGPLFLGLSFFLVVSALVLTGLLFALNIEQRREETGTLLALGFTRKKAGRLLLYEGILLASAGALLGTLAGVGYTWMMVTGLSTFWSDAVTGASVGVHVKGMTLLTGGLSGVVMAIFAIWITLKRQGRHAVRSLLDGTVDTDVTDATLKKRGRSGFVFAAVVLAGAAVIVISALSSGGGSGSGAGAFFSAGALFLLGGVGLIHGLLTRRSVILHGAALSLRGFGLRNTARRRGRSLSAVVVLACGTFLVFAVAANRKNPLDGAELPGSGTGGFAFIGETSLPVLHGLDTKEGRRALGLAQEVVREMEAVNVRVRDGDDASCLNLNRTAQPRILGVAPGRLGARGAFTFVQTLEGDGLEDPWSLLESDLGGDVVPAVADHPTIIWGLGKKVGDTLDYVDERGRPFQVRLVGAFQSSILQGSLLISETHFVERFPSVEGYRIFLLDAPREERAAIGAALARAGRNEGLEVIPAVDRLAAYLAVENTYLSIFQTLGGLGLLLGSAGLAFVLFRNVMERRNELAVLQAMGYTRATIRRLLFLEHGWLLVAGLICGVTAAVLAVWPALRSPGAEPPWMSLVMTLAVILAGGFLWIYAAAVTAAGREFLPALRNE